MMKKYDDFKKDKDALYLTKEEMAAVKWTKYVIVVPTEEGRPKRNGGSSGERMKILLKKY